RAGAPAVCRRRRAVRSPHHCGRAEVLVLIAHYSVDLNSSRLGVPDGFPVMTLVVALLMIQFDTVADAASPKVALYRAATPVTCGVAIDVPLRVMVVPRREVGLIDDPGLYAS